MKLSQDLSYEAADEFEPLFSSGNIELNLYFLQMLKLPGFERLLYNEGMVTYIVLSQKAEEMLTNRMLNPMEL